MRSPETGEADERTTASAAQFDARRVHNRGWNETSTATVAQDVSDIAGTLPPVMIAVSSGLEQFDTGSDDINSLLDSVPFTTGSISGVDSDPLDIDQLLLDLDAASADDLDQQALTGSSTKSSSSSGKDIEPLHRTQALS